MKREIIDHISVADQQLSMHRPVAVQTAYHGRRPNLERRDPRLQGLPVRCLMVYPEHPYRVQSHEHEFYEVVLVCSGLARHVAPDGETVLTRGAVVVVPPRAVHAYEDLDELVIVNVHYIAEWLSEELPSLWHSREVVHLFLGGGMFRMQRPGRVTHYRIDEGRLMRCLSELRDIEAATDCYREQALFIRSSFLKTLALLGGGYESTLCTGDPAMFRDEVWTALDAVERHVANATPFDVAQIARDCAVHPDHLARLFREAIGCTPMAYYQSRRAQQAARRLLVPGTTITQVCHELGYCDSSHFRRLFRRYYGMSPRTFRNSFRQSRSIGTDT